MKISTLKDGTIKLNGELVVTEIETIYHDIEQILDNSSGGLVLDLSEVSDIDTAGLQLLTAIKKNIEDHATFQINKASDEVKHTLKISGFDLVFKEVA